MEFEDGTVNRPPWEGTSSTRILSDLDSLTLFAAPDDPLPPDAPTTTQAHYPLKAEVLHTELSRPPPQAPGIPVAPPPPEVNVESEVMPGWPKWLVEELENKHKEANRGGLGIDEENGGITGSAYYRDGDDRMSEDRESFDAPGTGNPVGSCASARLAKFPLICALCFLILFLIPIIVGLFGLPFIGINKLDLKVETTFDAFLQTDVPAAVALQSFNLAMADRPGTGRRLQAAAAAGKPYSAVKDLALYYVIVDSTEFEGGVLTANRISAVARFEQKLKSLPKWKDLCSRVQVGSNMLCDPGLSMGNYARATWGRVTEDDLKPNALRFDGRGRNALNGPTASFWADSFRLSPIFLPSGTKVLPGGTVGTLTQPMKTWQVPVVQSLRSVFRFKIYCCDQDSSTTAQRRAFNDRINDEWTSFIRNDLYPLVSAWNDHGLRVYLDGSNVEMTEVKLALWGDIWLAIGSMVFVHVYLLFHTRSFLLSLIGPLLAALALPLSFVVCGLIFGTTTVSFASALALFLTVGFGADVILVYTDFWRASVRRRAKEADRLAWTYRHAGGASFATTATTALSFFANLASAIRALRQFAFLMGLCVVFAWILISLIYTPLCIWNERLHKKCFKGRAERLATEAAMNSRILTRTVATLHKARFWVVFLSIGAFACFIGFSLPNMAIGTSLPQIFPEDHNRARVEKAAKAFDSVGSSFPADFAAPPLQRTVCDQTSPPLVDTLAAPLPPSQPACHMSWCIASQSTMGGTAEGQCSCWRKHADTCVPDSRQWVRGVTRIVGAGTLTGAQIQQVTGDRLMWDGRLPGVLRTPVLTSSSGLGPLVMQDWLTGDVELMPYVEATGRYRLQNRDGKCSDFQDICFCTNSSYVCDFPGWTQIDGFALGKTARRAQEAPVVPYAADLEDNMVLARRTAMVPATVPESQQTKVRVGFGMWIRDNSPLIGDQTAANSWGYVDTFIPSDPWTQRTMFKFCDELPVALVVARKWCWVEDFRSWLINDRASRFPTRDFEFHTLALTFADTSFPFYGTSGRKYIWVEESKIKAFYFTFMIDVPSSTRGAAALEHMGNWDTYMNHFTEVALSEGKGPLGMFHVSSLWAEAQAESELVRSTMVTITIVLVLAFMGMLTFTRSLVLSAYVVLATLQVMAGLVFFITVIMQWKIGLIEVIAIIYFVGYAVTYPLHVAHKYADSEALQVTPPADMGENDKKRYQRTKWAIKAIGGAALGSAMTTAGASLFLVFCTLNVFGKLGAMCLAVTVLSILTALLPLPALLLIVGPPRPGMCDHGR